jgi:hypothetical protein
MGGQDISVKIDPGVLCRRGRMAQGLFDRIKTHALTLYRRKPIARRQENLSTELPTCYMTIVLTDSASDKASAVMS